MIQDWRAAINLTIALIVSVAMWVGIIRLVQVML